jgi:hypothetical protein
MTPKEEALRLMDNFENAQTIKDCALVAVDAVLNVIDNFEMIYWEQVKQEIETYGGGEQ